jgi:hypothetical protein
MSRSDTSHNAELDQAMSRLVEQVCELRINILEARVDDEHVWFRNLLLGILNSALLDYTSIKIGAQELIDLAAWRCRNLLELRIITTYVLDSEANAAAFHNDLLIDTKEFYEAVSNANRALHAKFVSMLAGVADRADATTKITIEQYHRTEVERGPQTEDSDSQATIYRQIMSEFGIKGNVKYKRASEMAAVIQEKEFFDPMFRICSKIMHRTAFSIASSIDRGSLDEVMPLLANSAASDLLSIHESIKGHFEDRGVQPPEP